MRRCPVLQDHTFGQGFVDLLMDNAHESGINLSTTIGRQGTVSRRDMVKQENKVESDGNQELNNRQHPDDQSEEHAAKNHGSQIVVLREDLNILEELHTGRAVTGLFRILTTREQIHLHNRIESDGIDNLARSVGKDCVHPG